MTTFTKCHIGVIIKLTVKYLGSLADYPVDCAHNQ
jgi:hypothetical protein